MSELRALQEAFQAYVMHRHPAMLAHVVGTARADARRRLEIYRPRLLEALSSDYPGVRSLLGDAQFERLGRAYVDARPSHHPSLRWFGAGLAQSLQVTLPYAEQPLLAELARFEWLKGEVFDAGDAAVVDLQLLAGLGPERWGGMTITTHPSLRYLELVWNAPAIWQALDAGEEPPPPAARERALSWALWRKDLQPHWRSLGAGRGLGVAANVGGDGLRYRVRWARALAGARADPVASGRVAEAMGQRRSGFHHHPGRRGGRLGDAGHR